jgi:hypothetical protein
MADPEDLNAKLKAAATSMVGKDAVESKFGIDCFGLVDVLLRSVDANSAHDYRKEVPITATAHYKWGDGIFLDSIEPGDILQFKKHVVTITTVTSTPKETRTDTRTLSRPHHTAIVLDVQKDGEKISGVTVVEQNVAPHPRKVTRSFIPKLDEGQITKTEGNKKITIKVTGLVSAYRPVAKSVKGAILLPSQSFPGRRAKVDFIPAHGGPKRQPGPVGIG